MEFMNNISNFFNHIYSDIRNYVSHLFDTPGGITIVVSVLFIALIFAILHERT